MKIARDQQTKAWVLSTDSAVLYRGRMSPWDHPEILREARAREAELQRAPPRGSPRK
jgi:hypothetical protein